ncbi:cell cycle control protein [Crepidotus variabilis]|uniref:Cell cycle control protein n=1 Tax=Crepidotus variabilis TaxID=179855 RepID=A0A9P6EP25_9AGAR|nr:cell cycle control protein [Crepidotus variabilis]
MGLFNRKNSTKPDSDDPEHKKEKGGWKRPKNTAFKQQRMKAWQPILTPKTVLPTLFLIGIIFAPIGGLLIWGSSLVTEITFDYTECENLTPSSSNGSLTFTDMPSNKYKYRLKNDKGAQPSTPQYAFLDNDNNSSVTDVSAKKQCIVEFDIPQQLDHTVLLYYKLTNFYQNHRRYVKSLSTDQLKGKFVSVKDLNNGDCKPLATINNTAIWPCGLIANSVFNDTFSTPVLLNPSGSDATEKPYEFSSQGIAWPGEAKKYTDNPIGDGGYQSLSDIVPPPNWQLKYPHGYTEDNPPPNLKADQHFQNWMRTAGLPSFTKLYGRNDNDPMQTGKYRIIIGLNFPVIPYKGTKSFVISTVSWIGGKNPFLGWAYVAAAAVFVLLAILGTARHLIRPRRLGDMTLLSWNR